MLWKVLGELAREEEGFAENLRVRLIGPTDHTVNKAIAENGLEKNLEQWESLPHDAVIKKLCESWVLLLPLNDTPNIKGVIPGKLYEYLGAGRPIFCTGLPEGDCGWIIKKLQAGYVIGLEDEEGMKAAVKEILDHYRAGEPLSTGALEKKKDFSRKRLAGNIANKLFHIAPSKESFN